MRAITIEQMGDKGRGSLKRVVIAAQAFLLLGALTIGTAVSAAGPTTVDLGRAGAFAVLAGSAITNTGNSVITGDIGSHPTDTITGFPPGVLSTGSTNHAGSVSTANAQTDLVAAYTDAAGRSSVTTVPTELGSTTKTTGVYDTADGTLGLTGTLTLDAQGDATAVFIFKAASTLTTASSSNITLANGAQACNVFWQIGSSATLGTNSTFRGNILALTSITATTGATVDGRLLARNGAVTLDTNTVTKATCAVAATSTPTPTASASTSSSSSSSSSTDSSSASSSGTSASTTSSSATSSSSAKFPNAGTAPEQSRTNLYIVSAAIAGILLAGYLVRRKRISQL